MAEVVVALDLPSVAEASRLLDRLSGARWVKVGSVLFTRAGPSLVEACRQRGLEVFLDLKWHDIPNTVAGAVRSARDLGVAMVTVHTLGGPEMMAAAAEAAARSLLVVGVTVLTSHDAAGFEQVVGRRVEVGDEVLRLAQAAARAGLDGVVCSPHEVALARQTFPPGRAIVVPGIRGAGDARGDQARVATAAQAVRAGATHLVVGRPILQAGDPAAVLRRLQEEVEEAADRA